MRESDLMREAIREMKKIPMVMLWRCNAGRRAGIRFGEVGMPDVCGIVGKRGRFFGCEFKTDKGDTTPEQDEWHRKAVERGALIYVARTIEEAVRPLMEELR